MVSISKLEIDVYSSGEIRDAIDFAIKNKCTAIVVPPDLVLQANLARGVHRGKFKIISTVDYPKGVNYCHDKMRGMPVESLSADGFEILLSKGDKASITKEVTTLSKFLRDYLPSTTELRFTLGTTDKPKDQIETILNAMKLLPQPAMVRTAQLSKVKVSYGTIKYHNDLIDEITSIFNTRVKLSGNITREAVLQCSRAVKFGVSLSQAVAIAKAPVEAEQAAE